MFLLYCSKAVVLNVMHRLDVVRGQKSKIGKKDLGCDS